MMVTCFARPFSTATSTTTSPAGVSNEMVVTGSITFTNFFSTSAVATPMVPCPHIGRHPDTSIYTTPQSASGRVGFCKIAPLMALCPRGSNINHWRQKSMCSMKCRRFSNIVAPGISPMPEVTTRVGIPSVCVSTVVTVRMLFIRRSYPGLTVLEICKSNIHLTMNLLLFMGRQRKARKSSWATVTTNMVHSKFDCLNEFFL